jgi:hypothetical protein
MTAEKNLWTGTVTRIFTNLYKRRASRLSCGGTRHTLVLRGYGLSLAHSGGKTREQLPTMNQSTVPTITLNNGVPIPQVGLGVWQAAEGEEVETAVRAALDSGYRLIDTAAIYGNEVGVGKAIKASGLPREEIFITTKLWNANHAREDALRAFDESLKSSIAATSTCIYPLATTDGRPLCGSLASIGNTV